MARALGLGLGRERVREARLGCQARGRRTSQTSRKQADSPLIAVTMAVPDPSHWFSLLCLLCVLSAGYRLCCLLSAGGVPARARGPPPHAHSPKLRTQTPTQSTQNSKSWQSSCPSSSKSTGNRQATVSSLHCAWLFMMSEADGLACRRCPGSLLLAFSIESADQAQASTTP